MQKISDEDKDQLKSYIKSYSTSGLIGIWWIKDNQVVADYKTIDQGYNDESFINYDEKKNHLTEWSRVIKEYFPEEADSIIQKGYKSLERGRVVYNLRTQCYKVWSSPEVFSDLEKRKLIAHAFNLIGCRVDFVVENNYCVSESDENPDLDSFEYDF